jgi:hypothetical protein
MLINAGRDENFHPESLCLNIPWHNPDPDKPEMKIED